MSDGMGDSENTPGLLPRTESPMTAGAQLRAARERAGLHIAALAVAIKIPVKKLEALESDQLQETHDVVFTRALASSVCRTLKIDSKPILDALPQSKVKDLHVDDNGINAPFVPSSVARPPSVEVLKQPWMMLVVALCVGALVLLTMGHWEPRDSSQPSAIVAEEPATPPVVIPSAAVQSESGSGAQLPGTAVTTPVAAPVPMLAASEVVASNSISAVSKESEVKPPVTAPASGDKAQAVAVGSELVMAFRAKHQSVWVEVIDARGDVRLRRNLGAGERVECGGVLPLSVVLGRADSVDVEVRGKPFNFSQFARDNVAKFEVR